MPEITVDAKTKWHATGVVKRANETIRVSYLSGSWSFNPRESSCGPEGHPHLVARDGYVLPGAKEGALIGRLGQNPPFLVGRSFASSSSTVTDRQEGELFLIINEDIDKRYGQGLDDNSGALRIDLFPASGRVTDKDICRGTPIESGYVLVTTRWDPTRCGNPSNVDDENVWSISLITSYPVGSVVKVCANSPVPSGWEVINIYWDPTKCGHPPSNINNMKEIIRRR